MNTEIQTALRGLLHGQKVAALGTLHHGEASVSMVPYALSRDEPGLLIHVSALASHTRDMQVHAAVSMMVMDAATGDAMVHALPRATIQGLATPLERDTIAYDGARTTYLERFPLAAPIFELGDFSLWLIKPQSLRFIAGFGQAHAASEPEVMEAVLLSRGSEI